MADKSAIEWTDATWNPIVGCSIVSPGCTNCYAMKMAARIEHMRAPERRGDAVLPHHYTALTAPSKAGPVWTGRVNIAPDHILTQPLRWKRGRRIFVNSMGDLFHESIPDEWIDRVFAVMALCPQHPFQVLTKRAARMRDYLATSFDDGKAFDRVVVEMMRYTDAGYPCRRESYERHGMPYRKPRSARDWWPLPNVWLGVSTERQQEADERIPLLLQTPAALRFISAEPLLGPVKLRETLGDDWLASGKSGERKGLDWVIVGGESGPGARPMHPQWARSLRDQCAAAGVPFFFKQWGAWEPSETAPDRMIVSYDGDVDIPDGRAADESASEVEMLRVGKKAAGRLLDGREHNEFPEAQS